MDVINAFEPKTFDQTAGILTEGLCDEIITEVERLEQQPKQVNIGEFFDISTCESVYLDEMVAKFGLEFPELDASRVAKGLSDCGIHQPDTSLNRHAINFGQISPNLQKSGLGAQQFLPVASGEFMALKIQVEHLTKMFLKLQEEFHKSTETHQINPQTLLNEKPQTQQTEVEEEPPATTDEGARPYLRIEEINNVSAIERLPLYVASETKGVREIENVHRNVTPLTEEFNERSVIVTPSEEPQEGLSSSHTLPEASSQEDYFNQSQNERSPSESGQSQEDIGVQPLSMESNERSVIFTRSKDKAAHDVGQLPESKELVSSPLPTLLRREDSLQTKQVRCGRERKNYGNRRKREPETHFCKECNKGFILKCNLKTHVRIRTGEKPFKCGDCGVPFRQKSQLTAHQRIHTGEKPFKCGDCDVAFSQKHHLTIHQRIHTGEKPFKCGDCDVAFSQKQNLTVHQRIHTGEKPFKCGDCDVAFSQKHHLTIHQRIHTGEKPFKCGDCDVAFSQKQNLTVHQRIHTGEKPFKCGDCDVAFSQKHHLTIHQRIHTGERPFVCDICKKSFRYKQDFLRHMRVHSGRKLHKCEVCKEEFGFKSGLMRHSRAHAYATFKKNQRFTNATTQIC